MILVGSFQLGIVHDSVIFPIDKEGSRQTFKTLNNYKINMLILISLIQRFLKTWTKPCKATLKQPEYNVQSAVNAIFNFPFMNWS